MKIPSWLIDRVDSDQVTRRWHGLVIQDFYFRTLITMPLGLHLIASFSIRAWRWFRALGWIKAKPQTLPRTVIRNIWVEDNYGNTHLLFCSPSKQLRITVRGRDLIISASTL